MGDGVRGFRGGVEGVLEGIWARWPVFCGEFCVVVLVVMWIFGRVKAHEEDGNPVHLLRHQDGGRGVVGGSVCFVDEWGRNIN